MTSYEFTLRLNREVTDAEIEALYEAGCDDAGIETGPLGTLIEFDREAPSLAQAISSAARDIDKVPGLRAVGVACDGCPALPTLATQYAEAGGRLLVCPICFSARQLDDSQLVPNARLGGATPLWEWIGNDPATVFSY